MGKTYFIMDTNSSCPENKVNVEFVRKQLLKNGWKEVRTHKNATIVLTWFCCMTTLQIDDSIAQLRQIIKEVHKGKIYIGGCISKSPDIKRAITVKYSEVAFFKDNELFDMLGIKAIKSENVIEMGNMATVTISYGCKRKCAFCKVHYIDYECFSVPIKNIIENVLIAKEKGHKFILLDAMNATEYSDNGQNLADLLKELLKIPDVMYKLNGIVLAELTDEMISIIQNPRFFQIQMEVQSFISEVRKNMNVGLLQPERIIEILKKFKDKRIISNIMVGFYGERDKNFEEQLHLIIENNFYFLTINFLIPTPGTPSANMRNPSKAKVMERMSKLREVLLELKKKKAKAILGNTVSGIVIESQDKVSVVLIDGGIYVETLQLKNVSVGQRVSVTPKYVKTLMFGKDELLILATEETEASKLVERLKAEAHLKGDNEAWEYFNTIVSPEELYDPNQPDSNTQLSENFNQPHNRTIYGYVKELIGIR